MSPADFWRLDIDSVWWFVEAKMGVKMAGDSLTEDDADELIEMLEDRGI
jgi:hypothetical protein